MKKVELLESCEWLSGQVSGSWLATDGVRCPPRPTSIGSHPSGRSQSAGTTRFPRKRKAREIIWRKIKIQTLLLFAADPPTSRPNPETWIWCSTISSKYLFFPKKSQLSRALSEVFMLSQLKKKNLISAWYYFRHAYSFKRIYSLYRVSMLYQITASQKFKQGYQVEQNYFCL